MLVPGTDWYETPRLQEIRPCTCRVLMTLVGIHAQVSHIVKGLLDRALHANMDGAAEEASRSFREGSGWVGCYVYVSSNRLC
ncbi:hypothetical protein EDD17DRAFT_1615977 [Pisolithus thermaeus]|nr:hypothetical protein EDD17DRAFT_1615977 [Pisolithus thermaeus]